MKKKDVSMQLALRCAAAFAAMKFASAALTFSVAALNK